MKLFLALCLLAAALVLPAAAQQQQQQQQPASSATPPVAAAAPMREDERIPFMEEQERAASGNSAGSGAPGAGGLIVRTMGALCLVGALIFEAAWGLKKFGGFKFGKTPDDGDAIAELTVLSTVTLGANRTLSVVRFGEKTLLIGSTAQTMALLASEDSSGGSSSKTSAILSPVAPRSVAEMLAADNDEDDDFSSAGDDDRDEDFSFDETLADAEKSLLGTFRGGTRAAAATERSKTI